MAMVVTIGVQHLHNTALSKDVQDYAAQIDQLQADAIKANSDAAQARIIADRETAASKMKAAQIMKQKVPNDCEKSILWAANEAHKL